MTLLERSRHLAALDEHLASVARSAHGRIVFLEGEAGAGKTALVRAFCADRHTLAGACDALFTPRPLGPFRDIALQVGGQLQQLTERGARPYETAAALMDALRGGCSTVLVLEDLHWADEASLDVLRLVARRIEGIPVLVLATYREDELDRVHPLRVLLGELATSASVARLRVEVLSSDAVARLAEPYGVDAGELFRRTGGNAFFVTEALSAADEAIPPTVRDAVLARAARLGPVATRLLETVAVIPPAAETWAIERMAPEAVDALDECLASGMLSAMGNGVAFRHELARQAIEASLTPRRRVALHRAALEALSAPPVGAPDLARLAHHAEVAADTEAVVRFAPAAAAIAASLGAHREAAAQYARALRFAADLPAVMRGELLQRQSHECFLTDQLDQSIAAGRAAVDAFRESGESMREAAALRALSSHLWCMARPDIADRVGQQAVTLLESLPPTLETHRVLTMAYGAVASVCMNADDAAGTADFGARALGLAQQVGDVEALVYALNTIGTMQMLNGRREGRQKLERSMLLGRAAGLEEHVGRAYIHLAWAATRTRQHLEVEPILREGLQYCDERGLLLWRRHLIAFRSRFALDGGDWSLASDLAAELLRDPRTANPRIHALLVLGLARVRRGDPDYWASLDEAHERAGEIGQLQFLGPAAAARAEAAWLEGRPERVAAATDTVLPLARRRAATWVIGELLVWRQRAGLPVCELDAAAEPYALELRGDWRQAAEAWAERGCPYEAALALASAPEEDALRASLAELQRLGARPAASIVARRLRELGARGLPRGPRPSTRGNRARLTTRQVEILELLSAGLPNNEIAQRLFLSSRTVEHHVSAILDKLGARTRTEASHLAREALTASTSSQPAPNG